VKVFISWSGQVSRNIAEKIYEWLPMVLQSVQPYMSSESIDKGARWANSISGELEDAGVGIVVLTPENINAPWIHFESGALAKVVGDSKLAPLLCGLKPSDVGTPLSQFQVTVFNKDDVLKLLKSINACSGDDALPESRLEKMHNALWDDLSKDIDPIIASSSAKVHTVVEKPEEETSRILEELLVLTRQQSQAVFSADKILSPSLIRTIIEIANEGGPNRLNDDRIRSAIKYLRHRWQMMKDIYGSLENLSAEGKAEEFLNILGDIDLVIDDLTEMSDRKRTYRRRLEGEPVRVANAFAQGPGKA